MESIRTIRSVLDITPGLDGIWIKQVFHIAAASCIGSRSKSLLSSPFSNGQGNKLASGSIVEHEFSRIMLAAEYLAPGPLPFSDVLQICDDETPPEYDGGTSDLLLVPFTDFRS